jgi:signal transduction histidine kinase
MDDGFGCPHCGATSPALKAMSDAVLAIAAERSVGSTLQTIVDAARDLVRARYAALGVPDGRGGFAQFITSGMSDEQIAAIGPLPRTHGLLDAMLQDPRPYRTPDVQEDPRYRGWPDAHPDMRSFMGVPIVSRGAIIGAFYLTDSESAGTFTEADQHLIEMLATHAAIAIENARLYERSRELTVVEERNRLARDLHDSVSQTLFSVVLSAEAAGTLMDRDPPRAKAEVRRLQALASGALQEMRALIFELRSAELEADGLVPTLRKHVDVLCRLRQGQVSLAVRGERRLKPELERQVFRIAQEALNNALKHAQANAIQIDLEMRRTRILLAVADDGVGFDTASPQARSKRLGLTSRRERAEAVGGDLRVESGRGRGTRVCLEVPLGR